MPRGSMKRVVLAGSESYKLFFRYEEATIEGGDIPEPLVVAEFLYPVECGCIDTQEKWVVTGGQGLVFYYFRAPLKPFELEIESSQWNTLWHLDNDINMYVDSIVQIGEEIVRVLIGVNSDKAAVYDINVYSLEAIKRL